MDLTGSGRSLRSWLSPCSGCSHGLTLYDIVSTQITGRLFTMLLQRPRGTRFFHNIALIILLVSSIAYFSMASDLGATPIQTEFRAQGSRQIWVCPTN